MIPCDDEPVYVKFGEIVLELDEYDYHAVALAIKHRLRMSRPAGNAK